jgi:hypothetical protein
MNTDECIWMYIYGFEYNKEGNYIYK